MLSTHNPLAVFRTPLPGMIRLCAVLLAVLAPGFGAALRAADGSTGIVTGRVFNAATNTALNNARVTIDGTARQKCGRRQGDLIDGMDR